MAEDEEVYPCYKCGKDIETTDVFKGGRHHHLECFMCTSCGNAMSTRRFFTGPDGEFYCNETCSKNPPSGPPTCHRCEKVIEDLDNRMNVGDKKYHEKCFKCTECLLPIARVTFYESKGSVYCEVCYRTLITNMFAGNT